MIIFNQKMASCRGPSQQTKSSSNMSLRREIERNNDDCEWNTDDLNKQTYRTGNDLSRAPRVLFMEDVSQDINMNQDSNM